MDDDLVTAAAFLNPCEAYVARNRLCEEGVRCVLDNEALASMDWRLTNAVGGVKLLVRRWQLDRAQAILAEARRARDGEAAAEQAELPTQGEEMAQRAFKLSMLAPVPVFPYVSWLLWRVVWATPHGQRYPTHFGKALTVNVYQWCAFLLAVLVVALIVTW